MAFSPGQFGRILASGFSYTVFGLFGLLISLVVIPALYLIPVKRDRRQEMGRCVIRFGFGRFIRLLNLVQLIRTSTRIDPTVWEKEPFVIVSNHPTFFDVVFLISSIPNALCIVKEGVWNNPVMSLAVRTAGYIPNTHTEELVQTCVNSVKGGRSMIIFPEGTRSFSHRLQPFKRGAATIAVRARAPILPVVITSTPTQYKGTRWYNQAHRRCDVVLKVSEPIDIEYALKRNRNDSLAARELTKDLETYYKEELKTYFETC